MTLVVVVSHLPDEGGPDVTEGDQNNEAHEQKDRRGAHEICPLQYGVEGDGERLGVDEKDQGHRREHVRQQLLPLQLHLHPRGSDNITTISILEKRKHHSHVSITKHF